MVERDGTYLTSLNKFTNRKTVTIVRSNQNCTYETIIKTINDGTYTFITLWHQPTSP